MFKVLEKPLPICRGVGECGVPFFGRKKDDSGLCALFIYLSFFFGFICICAAHDTTHFLVVFSKIKQCNRNERKIKQHQPDI